MMDLALTLDVVIKMVLAAALGALVGIERQIMHKPAGLRTHMLVSLGSCIFTIIAIYSFPNNPSAILAGILTGIGFIGAGCIMGNQTGVQGITTAATLWVVGSIGFVTGTGNYLFAIIAAIFVFLILKLGTWEKKIK
jgi:putative Mg2+ transporter-C (MgtC) family protein